VDKLDLMLQFDVAISCKGILLLKKQNRRYVMVDAFFRTNLNTSITMQKTRQQSAHSGVSL
jgi:hypothetical protein